MKYIKELGIILGISCLGELLNRLIPLPIPASIYGLVLLLFCLCCKIFSVDAVKHTAHFLLEIMPLTFIPAAVGLMASWSAIRQNLLAYLVIAAVSTVVVMLVSGRVTQRVLRHDGRKGE